MFDTNDEKIKEVSQELPGNVVAEAIKEKPSSDEVEQRWEEWEVVDQAFSAARQAYTNQGLSYSEVIDDLAEFLQLCAQLHSESGKKTTRSKRKKPAEVTEIGY